MDKKVIIIGGEGNGGVVASCIEDNRSRFNDSEWVVAGFLNDFEKGKTILGYPVLGGTDDIEKFIKEDYYFMYAILTIGGPINLLFFTATPFPSFCDSSKRTSISSASCTSSSLGEKYL